MVLRIYGHCMTACTQRVIHYCKEAEIPYDFVPVDLTRRVHKTDAYSAKSPFSLLPYIDDEGFVLYESRAIVRYLAAKTGKFVPSPSDSLQTLARFEQAMSVEVTNFDPYAFALVRELVLGPSRVGRPVDPVNVKRHMELLESRLQGHERILSRQRYLAGDEVTIADFSYLPFGQLLLEINIGFFEDTDKFPHIARWWKEISDRPAFKEMWAERNGWELS